MATFFAIIFFGVSCHYYNKDAISLEMLLLIGALGLIVFAIDCRPTVSAIEEALTTALSKSNGNAKETPSSPNNTNPDDEDSYYFEDSDEYPHLHR